MHEFVRFKGEWQRNVNKLKKPGSYMKLPFGNRRISMNGTLTYLLREEKKEKDTKKKLGLLT